MKDNVSKFSCSFLLSFGRDPEDVDIQFDADSFMDTVGNLLGTYMHSITSNMLSWTMVMQRFQNISVVKLNKAFLSTSGLLFNIF